MANERKADASRSGVSSAALSAERVASALTRTADLWPDGLDAVPGSYEVALKRDADTIRALAAFWKGAAMFTDALGALANSDELLRRLSEWDVLNLAPGSGDDGPYWQGEIDNARVLNRLALLRAKEAV